LEHQQYVGNQNSFNICAFYKLFSETPEHRQFFGKLSCRYLFPVLFRHSKLWISFVLTSISQVAQSPRCCTGTARGPLVHRAHSPTTASPKTSTPGFYRTLSKCAGGIDAETCRLQVRAHFFSETFENRQVFGKRNFRHSFPMLSSDSKHWILFAFQHSSQVIWFIYNKFCEFSEQQQYCGKRIRLFPSERCRLQVRGL